jgi:hypothetical protein
VRNERRNSRLQNIGRYAGAESAQALAMS